jgi:hypothetical protein
MSTPTTTKRSVLRRVISHLFEPRPVYEDHLRRPGYSHFDDAAMAMFGFGRVNYQDRRNWPPRY